MTQSKTGDTIMPLFTCGINHHSAPIHIRERLAFSPKQTMSVLGDLKRLEAVNEAVLLSTCNRTEIYMAGNHPRALQHWLRQQLSAANMSIDPHSYIHQEEAAVRHLLRVSSGLDSMALGEPQIFGQVKQAYRMACEAGTAGQVLQHLFPAAFAASKTIRQETQIGSNPVSMAYATVQIARRIFSNLSQCCVLLIGAGDQIELMLTHLQEKGVRQMIVANRTVEKAQRLAVACKGSGIRIGDIPAYLPEADIVISATASQLPIIGKGLVERTFKARKRRPILIVDLAVPRDIEPEVSQLTDIYLYNIDDLQTIINANLKNRAAAAKQAEALVEIQTLHYLRQQRIYNSSAVITQYRREAEKHRDDSLLKAVAELKQGRDPIRVVGQLAHRLTNKILHQPTMKLRRFADQQQSDALALARKLLITEEV